MSMVPPGCILHCVLALVAAMAYTLGAPTPDDDQPPLDVSPLWRFGPSQLDLDTAEVPPQQYGPSGYADDSFLVPVDVSDVPARFFKRQSPQSLASDERPLNVYKRKQTLRELVTTLNRLMGRNNNRSVTLLRFGFSGRRK